jgi:hypothetical protein
MAISVTIGGPEIHCLELMSPAVPEFDAAVHSLFRGNSVEQTIVFNERVQISQY